MLTCSVMRRRSTIMEAQYTLLRSLLPSHGHLCVTKGLTDGGRTGKLSHDATLAGQFQTLRATAHPHPAADRITTRVITV